MTGPVERFARQIAGQGYIVAAPSSYHEFTGPEPLAYDGAGTDAGNKWKIEKVLLLSTLFLFFFFRISLDLFFFLNKKKTPTVTVMQLIRKCISRN